MTTLYIIRHGQSEANAAGILQGSQIDTPLTAKGRQQALTVRQKLAATTAIHFDLVFASPLLRAAQTAQLIAPHATTIFDSRLREFDYGDWDGQLEADIHRKYSEFFDDQFNLLPGSEKLSHGEDFQTVTARLDSFFTELAQTYPQQTLLVASHGFTIKLMLNAVLGINHLTSLNEPLNAGLTKISLSPTSRTLLFFNQTL
ncbi:histidine phosphatase family protein [Liquorilactobacillus satsumensis]|uniref:Phosphoglycerate mutase n=1 Tax=Liquorilactobacillus satsumensis DSM 16230 = JCM 12392 TaxID=1423801 RepID=A0A0R1V250_9LACO|nr:histidine phosphatase family protein [Liquorilactobacillus satsumensis]KRL97272.1 phosphoglycerate mutase [Liquorilactobacillus satsumensis DSM 16230 = JCM 12392]MCC7666965.1 histidine phosphatase family protein [Liquorilactobacillus satsumensis]MCP9312221.1 histidine phosphatase family protein [Liquorilactobacillus satsumensis]MCP9328725.1 histidine phosphatase family protein [Liquorilactobacillus satsumensis]MCP9357247.1 histidine phosphatase family protein [Liquorilactobacillus satsumens